LLNEEFRTLRSLVRKLDVERWTLDQVVGTYQGRLRKRYEKARDSLLGDELNKRDYLIKPFLKAEKFNPLLKPSKPRLVAPRSPRYNLVLASYLKPLEHAIYRKLKGSRGRGIRSTRIVGKGLNLVQRAALIKEKMENVGEGCAVMEVDGIAFEAHNTRSDLKREQSVYLAAYGGSKELRDLLSCQLNYNGITANGIRFKRKGGRASGDFNTGLGNTLVMVAIVRAAMKLLSRRRRVRWDCLVDGDNALLFVHPEDIWVLSEFGTAVATVSAQELTLETPVNRLEGVVFGQSKPCWDGLEYKMVKNPFKTLSGAFSGYRHFDKYSFGLKVLKAISRCELVLARGIPVLEPYFERAIELLDGVPDLPDPSDFIEGRHIEAISILRREGSSLSQARGRGISERARISFAEAWGIDPERQRELEGSLVGGLSFPWVWRRYGRASYLGVKVLERLTDLWSIYPMTDGPDGESPADSIINFIGSVY